MKHTNQTLLGIVLLVTFGLPTVVLAQLYIEDFTTTTYRDYQNTTAWWDTEAGELKLFPLPTVEGTHNTPGDAFGVAVSGGHAFVADGGSGLRVIDISDPANPTLTGSYDTPGFAQGVAVSGDHAFVADYGSGLQVIDISDPANPMLTGSYDTPAYARGVVVSGDHAFVADGDSGLQVIDISDPTNPTLAGSYDTLGNARGVAVSGDHALVADGGSGLQVIDISDPTNPTHAGSYDTPNYAQDVAVSGDHALVADGGSGLQVIDILDPTNPTLAGSYDTLDYAHGVAISGDHVFVADYGSGLQVIDISDPMNPTLEGGYDTPGFAYDVALSGGQAFVADGGSGLQMMVFSEPSNPMFAGSYDTPGNAYGVAISGDFAFVADGGSGLQVIDVSDPTNPTRAVTFYTLGAAYDVAVSGDYALVADGSSGLLVVNISDPTNPTFAGSYHTLGSANDVAVSGDLTFLADSGFGLLVIDISDPTNPTLIGSYDTPDNVRGVAISGDYAFVADGVSGLLVIDISDPTDPTLSGSYDTPEYAQGVGVSGGHAFVADGGSGLQVIDISDPTNPTLTGSYDTPGYAQGVTVSGDIAFVADGDYGLQMLDISDPANPTLIGGYNTPGNVRGVALSGDYAYVADYGSGLQVIQVFQSDVNTVNNIGQSWFVEASNDTILRARLTTSQTHSIRWKLSADGGLNWQGIAPGDTWNAMLFPGTDLLWRSTHIFAVPGVNPSVSELEVEWLVAAAPIMSIVDVPDDQGGWVTLSLLRSAYDFADENSLPVTGYWIHQRIDSSAMQARVLEEGVLFDQTSKMNTSLELKVLGDVRVLADRTFIVNEEKVTSSFPPGIWEVVGSAPAMQHDYYDVRAPTLADSSMAGIVWTTYLVTTHTTTPSVWFASQPASGYSVDNIAPGVPQDILAGYLASGVTLDWSDAPEADFQFYCIYRDTEPGFVPSPDNLIHETASSAWTDPTTNPWNLHYMITVRDHAGNESEAGSPTEVTGVQEGAVPARTVLLNAVPNPFNPSTKLAFEMATAGHARLKVYDTAGRLVVTLVNEHRDAGLHEVTWDGRDDGGRKSAAGVYLYRLEAGDYSDTKRMVLIK